MTRFWEKVDIRDKDSCWNWKAGVNSKGYGQFRFQKKMCLATRMALVFTDGEVPDDLCVLHKCDNPLCVNPEHLYIGTMKDNAQDREIRGRGNHCKWEGHHKAKLTIKQVKEIRSRKLTGELMCSLAKEFGVQSSAVEKICKNRTWRGI